MVVPDSEIFNEWSVRARHTQANRTDCYLAMSGVFGRRHHQRTMGAMTCPKCGGGMMLGAIQLRGELWRQLTLWGMSWFEAIAVTKSRRVLLLRPWRRRPAFACAKCLWVVVPPTS